MIRKTVVVIDALETGRALRRLRIDKKISVRRLATMLGISPMAVSFYERGKRAINPATARHFVEAVYSEVGRKLPKPFHLVPEDEE